MNNSSEDWAEKWGYDQIDEVGVLCGLNIDSFSFSEQTENKNVQPFDPVSDLEDCVNVLVSKFGLPEADVKNFTLSLFTSPQTLAYYVVREKNNNIATGAIRRNQIVSNIGILSAMHDTGIDHLKSLLTKILRVARKHGIKKLLMFFTHLRNGNPIIEKYIALGFSLLTSNIIFEKQI
ncbi:hypothetical protein LCGC14_2990660 [marine sediment metagenome]|uniref:N-acetyltransferase domain-containing protein n=1 Tax=marine sediment metagenome TaxID=412755 RepID=A0A0F8ZBF2_9ZZZZ